MGSRLGPLTISEAADAIHGWHLDDKGEHIINEGVECLVCEHSPGEVGNRLELVVDEQLWSHCDEALGKGRGEERGGRGRVRREEEREEGGWKRKGVEGEAEGNEGGKNYKHKLTLVMLGWTCGIYSEMVIVHSILRRRPNCSRNKKLILSFTLT